MRVLFAAIMVLLAVGVIKYSLETASLRDEAARRLNLSSSTELAWKSVLETLSFNLYRGAQNERLDLSAYYVEAERKNRRAENIALTFLGVAAIYLTARWITLRRRLAGNMLKREIALDLVVLTGVAFVVGIVAPVMALSAHTELPVLGTVILKYESKSVVTALSSLMHSGNWFIALLIGLFSVMMPAAKTLVSLLCLQSRRPAWATKASHFIKAIGKWSMADVFVVAIFLAYFALGSDKFSDATAGLGLYFFAAYCLFSQFTSHYLLSAARAEFD